MDNTRARRVREILTTAARFPEEQRLLSIHEGVSIPREPGIFPRVKAALLASLVALPLAIICDGHRTGSFGLQSAHPPPTPRSEDHSIGYQRALCDPNQYAVEQALEDPRGPAGSGHQSEDLLREIRAF